jgi:ribonuclease E
MAKRMLIDAAHPEETRVAVLNGNRLEDFDFESSTKRQVKSNIYLAKVTRVEPSLQAAFVEYGGNRHGFLAFNEIHPDYYRIPVGDREAAGGSPTGREAVPELVAALDAATDAAATEAGEEPPVPLGAVLPEPVAVGDIAEGGDGERDESEGGDGGAAEETAAEHAWVPADSRPDVVTSDASIDADAGAPAWDDMPPDEPTLFETDTPASGHAFEPPPAHGAVPAGVETNGADAEIVWDNTAGPQSATPPPADPLAEGEGPAIETIGGDDFDEARRQHARVVRQYKIQEVIKRRQIMLVQVAKEERGTKGAALTTYLSLAGRYCVLMPNTARGGGVSRKITSISDRRRLKDMLEELDIPEGMGVIVRTAGAERSRAEIRRDYEYLLRLWNEIRDLTLRSTAPALIYEEGNLIKRSIRDLYTRDIDDVLVEGEDGYRTAKAFMKMLMPSHAKRVQPYRESEISLFHRFQVESQIDAIHAPSVQLRSGGYIVMNQTEALVAIDVNSGRSTRERNIEETALRTNLEAAEEIARQLRLRDLAGLIVIDFIDMEEHRNQAAVERRLKEILKNDRARIQVGRISPFGLLEMSRQRLRPSLAEASTQPCPHCSGTGLVRSTESTALYVLRSIEEEAMRRHAAEICVYVPTTVALYILNHKRQSLAQLEARYGFHVLVARDDALIPPAFRLERLRGFGPGETAAPTPLTQPVAEAADEGEGDAAADGVNAVAGEASAEEVGDDRRRRSRRRRRRRLPGEASDEAAAELAEPAGEVVVSGRDGDGDADTDRQRRRRGRRGGRRRLRQPGRAPGLADLPPAAETVEIVPTLPIAAAALDGFAPIDAAAACASEPAIEHGAKGETADIETASLPALAGDKAACGMGAAAPAELHAPQADPDARPPIAPPAASTIEIVDVTAAEAGAAAAAEVSAPVAAGNGTRQAEALPAWVAGGAVALPQPAGAAVQTVTQKPANPRRGWWQRLIQP